MKKTKDLAGQEEPGELPEELSWIGKTEGISVRDGIVNSGGVNAFIGSLKLFRDTIDSNAEALRSAYSCGDLKLYILKVHSLKSSARIAGIKDLSQLAASVEAAGVREDKAFVDENAGKLLEEYEKYKEKLSRL